MKEDAIGGRHIAREFDTVEVRDSVTGEIHASGSRTEVVETLDGVMERRRVTEQTVATCGHPLAPGEAGILCPVCSRAYGGRTMYACAACACVCPVCGHVSCLQHSVPGPGGIHRFCSKKCLKKGEKLGLNQIPVSPSADRRVEPFDTRRDAGVPTPYSAAPRTGRPPSGPVPSASSPSAPRRREGLLTRLARGVLSWW